jgi:hypothetical protein
MEAAKFTKLSLEPRLGLLCQADVAESGFASPLEDAFLMDLFSLRWLRAPSEGVWP